MDLTEYIENAFFTQCKFFQSYFILLTNKTYQLDSQYLIFTDQLKHIDNASHDSHVRKMTAKVTCFQNWLGTAFPQKS